MANQGQPSRGPAFPVSSLPHSPCEEWSAGFFSFPPSYLFSIGCLPASAPWLHPHGSPSLVHGTCGRASVLGPCSGPRPRPLDPAFPLPAPDAPVPLAHSSPSTEDPPCVHLPHPDWTSSGAPCAHTEPASRSAQPPDSSSFCPCQPPTHPTRQRTPWPGHVWLVLARLLRVFLSGRPAAGGLRLLFTDASAVLRSSARDRAPSEGPVSACGGGGGGNQSPLFAQLFLNFWSLRKRPRPPGPAHGYCRSFLSVSIFLRSHLPCRLEKGTISHICTTRSAVAEP